MVDFEKSTSEKRKIYTLIMDVERDVVDEGIITHVSLHNPRSIYNGSGAIRLNENKSRKTKVELFLCKDSANPDIAIIVGYKPGNIITDGESISPITSRKEYGYVEVLSPARDTISSRDRNKREGFLRILKELGL